MEVNPVAVASTSQIPFSQEELDRMSVIQQNDAPGSPQSNLLLFAKRTRPARPKREPFQKDLFGVAIEEESTNEDVLVSTTAETTPDAVEAPRKKSKGAPLPEKKHEEVERSLSTGQKIAIGVAAAAFSVAAIKVLRRS